MSKSARSHRPGPNDPCPCGSGKKAKKCCSGPSSASPEVSTRFTDAERTETLLWARDLVTNPEAPHALLAVSEKLLWGGVASPEALPADVHALAEDLQIDWILRQRMSDGRTMAGHLAADVATPPEYRACLRAIDGLPVRVYEVGQVHPGSGATLWDPKTDAQLRVVSQRLGRSAREGGFVLGRVLPVGPSGRAELDWPALIFPPEAEPLFDAFLEQMAEIEAERGAGAESGEGIRRLSLTLFVPWARILTSRQPDAAPGLGLRAMTTMDGDLMVPTRVEFEVLDAAALSATLMADEELERDGDAWAWMRPDPRGEVTAVSIGRVTLEGDSLVLQCLSEARAERGRQRLEARGGPSLRHRVTTTRTIESLLSEQRVPDRPQTSLGDLVTEAVMARLASLRGNT